MTWSPSMMVSGQRAAARGEREGIMRLSYGWVIVGVGIVVSCIAQGSVTSLGVFLQPMAEAQG